MRKNKSLLSAIIVVVILIFLVAFVRFNTTGNVIVSSTDKYVDIGVISMFSGPLASYGEKTKNGIELALDTIKDKNMLNKKINVIYEDDEADPKKCVTAAQKLINVNNVKIILGNMPSGNALAIAPLTEQSKVIVITGASSNPKIASAGEYLFTLVSLDNYEAGVMADFAYNNLSARRAGIIYVNDEYGSGLKDMFKDKFEKYGGKVVLTESFNGQESDFRTTLTKMKDKNLDVIYVVGYEELINLLKQKNELGVNSTFLSSGMVENLQKKDQIKKVCNGMIFTSLMFNINQDFKERFESKYKEEPDAFAAVAYDETILTAKALKYCNNENTDCIKDYLYNVKDYQGASGMITINSEGWVERPMSIKMCKNNDFVQIK